MISKNLHLFLATLLLSAFSSSIKLEAQTINESNLPILVINTFDSAIFDEPKITAQLGIIYNGEGQMNNINDPFNDYDGLIGIELRGQSSMSFPKKGYGIELRDEQGLNLNASILGFPEENDFVLHGPYSDKSLIRNALTYTLAAEIMDYAPKTKMVEVILNDLYIGVYLLTEKIKRDKNRIDISKLNPDEISDDYLTGGYIFKMDKTDTGDIPYDSKFNYSSENRRPTYVLTYPKNPSQPQLDYWKELINDFESSFLSENIQDPINGYDQRIGLSSFVNLFLINEISKNVDGYRLSTYFYKDRDSIDHKVKVGPVWDYNLAFGNADYCNGSLTAGWAINFNNVCPNDFWLIPFYWDKLFKNTDYRFELRKKWENLRQDLWTDEALAQKVDSLASLLQLAQKRNFQKWPVLDEYVWPNDFVGGSYANEIEYLKGWMLDRVRWMDEQLLNFPAFKEADSPGAYFKCYPNPYTENINFEFYFEKTEYVKFSIYNAQGKLMKYQEFRSYKNNTKTIRLGDQFAPGIYFYKFMIANGEDVSGTFIKK